ncbi:MAG TPA: SMI1/KNR4 family protein [Pseudobacteroides sp.]|uniref:SMI1/KNR4 family protein n=1 Tax=Pseudobacteroides sp. TaxID=1968840 RepID=UPI002F921608
MSVKEIKWSTDEKVDKNIINGVEKLWNIAFPRQYVDIVSNHNSSVPEVKNEDGEWKSGIINIPNWSSRSASFRLLSYNKSKYSDTPVIVATNEIFKDSVPDTSKIFAFAQDGAGNLLLFDYRKSSEPSIVFIDHEQSRSEDDLSDFELEEKSVEEWLEDNLYPVCNSFEELIDRIYPDFD